MIVLLVVGSLDGWLLALPGVALLAVVLVAGSALFTLEWGLLRHQDPVSERFGSPCNGNTLE